LSYAPAAAELHVCPGGCAYSSIQAAVDDAGPGDVIKVAQGDYTDVHAHAGLTQVLYISKTVSIQGGYTTSDWETPDPAAHRTTLDAQGQGRVVYVAGNAALQGLHITGGDATGLGGYWGGDCGGGIYITSTTASLSSNVIYSNTASTDGRQLDNGGGLCLLHSQVTLSSNAVYSNASGQHGGGLFLDGGTPVLNANIIRGNSAHHYGGGLYLNWSDATLSGNTISGNRANFRGGGLSLYFSQAILSANVINDNQADEGGGLYLYSSDATLNANAISSNTAGFGGGFYMTYGAPTLNGDLVSHNTASQGGGLCLWESSPTLLNTVVADNQVIYAGGGGAGLYAYNSSAPRLLHSTIARNSGGDGSGVHVVNEGSSRSSVVMTNTILVNHTVGITVAAGNTATLNSTLWHANDANWGGAGLIDHSNDHDGDPAFEADGYHLGSASAAIDQGVNAGVTSDVDGDARPFGSGPDLGADEFKTWRVYLPLIQKAP
jgi:parallel beta-helix repeat protein